MKCPVPVWHLKIKYKLIQQQAESSGSGRSKSTGRSVMLWWSFAVRAYEMCLKMKEDQGVPYSAWPLPNTKVRHRNRNWVLKLKLRSDDYISANLGKDLLGGQNCIDFKKQKTIFKNILQWNHAATGDFKIISPGIHGALRALHHCHCRKPAITNSGFQY